MTTLSTWSTTATRAGYWDSCWLQSMYIRSGFTFDSQESDKACWLLIRVQQVMKLGTAQRRYCNASRDWNVFEIIQAKNQEGGYKGQKKATKNTFNSWDSLVVTHPTTNQPACGLSTAERTGSPVFHTLWSNVVIDAMHCLIWGKREMGMKQSMPSVPKLRSLLKGSLGHGSFSMDFKILVT